MVSGVHKSGAKVRSLLTTHLELLESFGKSSRSPMCKIGSRFTGILTVTIQCWDSTSGSSTFSTFSVTCCEDSEKKR